MPRSEGAIMVRQYWSDEDLAQRLQQRDPEALEALISRYSREVYYFIRLVLDEIRQWATSDGSSNGRISGWGGHDSENRVTLPPHPESSMETLLEQSERREELRLALATLPELDRYLIYQRYFKFASTEELATKTGLTRHAVDTRLWRARKSLREALKEHAHEYERI